MLKLTDNPASGLGVAQTRPPEALHRAPNNAQAETVTLEAGAVEAHEGFEELASVIAAEADPVVADSHDHHLALDAGIDDDSGPGDAARELDCVADEVGQYRTQQIGIGDHFRLEFVRTATESFGHPVGTAKIGTDADAVVDS